MIRLLPTIQGQRRTQVATVLWCVLIGIWVWLIRGVHQRMTIPAQTPDRLYRDFYEFFSGAEALVRGTDLFAAGKLGYIYPPLFAVLMMPLVSLGLAGAGLAWLAIKAGLLGACTWLATRISTARFGIGADSLSSVVLALGGTLLIADKLRAEMNMQQSNLVMLLCWLLALLWLDRRPVLAGIVLGFSINIKYVTVLAVPYLLLRGRFRAAAATLASTIAWALLPALVLGWSKNLEYLRGAISGLVGATVKTTQANSGDGDARVMGANTIGSAITSWAIRVSGDAGLTLSAIGLVLAVAVVFAGAAWMIYWRRGVPLFAGRWGGAEQYPSRAGVVGIEWVGLIVIALCFSPQTNSPHLSQMLLGTVMAVAVLATARNAWQRWVMGLGLAVMVAGFVLPPGGQANRELVIAWQRAAGPSWCLLVMYLAMLGAGLRRFDAERVG